MKMNSTMLGILALAAMTVSCAKQTDGGSVAFRLDADLGVLEQTRSSVSDYTTLPSSGDFTIVLTGSNGYDIYNGLLSAYSESTSLKSGNYTVKASYGSTSDEGFGKPCFVGEKSFSITGGATTVSIPVSLENAIVKVSCTDLFKTYFTDYTFTLTTGAGTKIQFAKGETRAAFVDAYTISVSGTLTNQGGKTQTFTKTYDTSLSPKTCYTLTFDVSNVGGSKITVKLDDTVDDVELDDVELNN